MDNVYQGSLFDPPPPDPEPEPAAPCREERALARSTDPETSHEAAASVPVTMMEHTVVVCLSMYRQEYDPPGMTSSEIAERAGLARDSVSPRMRPLRDKDRIFDTGEKRRMESGRRQIVWDIRPETEEVE